MLDGYVYIDVAGPDLGSYVREAGKLIHEPVKLPAGYSIV
jgi:Cu(I)/Ag(I) efflux system membrane protein CusA/SilA